MSNETGPAMIQLACPQCKAVLTVPQSQEGTQLPCSGCGTTITVPVAIQAAVPRPPRPMVSLDATTVLDGPPPAKPPVSPDAPTVLETPTVVLSESSAVAADPAASPEFRAQTDAPPAAPAYTARSANASPRQAARPPAAPLLGGRRGVLAISVVLVLGAGTAVGITVSRDRERARIKASVEDVLGKARTAFNASDVAGAAKLAGEAGQQIAASPPNLVNPEDRKHWKTKIGIYEALAKKLDEVNKIAGESSKDLAGARNQLQNKRQLLEGDETNRPLVARIDAALSSIAKLEEKQKLEALRTDLLEANKLYKDGQIEDAAQKALAIGKNLSSKPRVQDRDLESRIEVLANRADLLKEAKNIRLGAQRNFADAANKLDLKLKGLDEANDDLKPLVARVAKLKREVQDEEKRSRRLNAQDSAQLENVAHAFARYDTHISVNKLEGETIGMEYQGKPFRLGMQRTGVSGVAAFLEASGYRMLLDPKALQSKAPRLARLIKHAIALGEAMKKADIPAGDAWDVSAEAPFVSGRRTAENGTQYIFLGEKLYTGKPLSKTDSEKEAEAAFEKISKSLEQAIAGDASVSEEVRAIVTEAVKAGYKEAEWYDHLPGDFIRRVLDGGYVQKNISGSAERYKKELADWHDAYQRISQPHLAFTGSAADGSQLTELRTFEDHAIWQIYDKAQDATTFAVKNPDDERSCLFILYDFKGVLKEFPANAQPQTVRMTHQAVGVTATYNTAAQKMTFDKERWEVAAAIEMQPFPPEFVQEKGFGTPECLPPHVLLVDCMGNTKSIVTPYGKLDVQDFSTIADPKARKDAMDAFLDQMAKVLPTSWYLHLYFRYFHEYIFDSPITAMPGLLGSRSHCGDIHQTVYESLGRLLGGRYIGDCDDLAEMFMTVTRRQGKLSYVMALPSHAACGWAEKAPGNSGEYSFYVIDTGPPRKFTHANLDKVIEMASRAYDETKTMRFDPKSLGFLFRFNGEPTRTPYWLSSRMYTDKEYGEAMERVQSYWHFHFYALGIKTMTSMIEKGDRVPENCTELAGLYGQVRETEESIKWTNEAIKQFGPGDRLSRYSEEFRVGFLWRDERDKQKAYDTVKGMIQELKQLEHDPQHLNYTSTRLQVMSLLEAVDRPWEGWDVVKQDIMLFASKGLLRIEHAGGLVNLYQKMQELIRGGKALTKEERIAMKELESILTWFFDAAVFAEPEEDFTGILRRYASLGDWYAGKFGQQKLVEELLKDGPYPDPSKPRDHKMRRNPEAEDWKWIRLSIPACAVAMSDAVKFEEPPEKWRTDEAVKLTDAMIRAAEHARKFGSLSSLDDIVLASRMTRAFIKKDWKELEDVLRETKKRDWARLTSEMAETFGRCSHFVTPEEFARQYRVFTKHLTARPAYFTVIYEAYRADGIQHALAACKVALESLPGDKDMAREAEYLGQLARKKLAAKAAKPAVPAIKDAK